MAIVLKGYPVMISLIISQIVCDNMENKSNYLILAEVKFSSRRVKYRKKWMKVPEFGAKFSVAIL